MADALKKLMLAYSRRGMRDWREADDALKRTARQWLCNSIAEQPHDVEWTIGGIGAEPLFIPMPKAGGDFEWCFYLPRKTNDQLKSLLLFMLVDRGEEGSMAFRFECSEEGRHGYSHVQLTSKLSKSGLSAMANVDALNEQAPFLSRWLPTSYPAFPVPARDWTEMFLAMATAVHGYRGGVDELIREIFGAGPGTRDGKHYNELLNKMLCGIT